MKEDAGQEAELRRYLLGELTLEKQVLLEQRLFLDSGYAQLAQSVEDDLIDEYVHDELTGVEREKFETRFLNQPGYSDDISIAQVLHRYLASEANPVGYDSRVSNITSLRSAEMPSTRKRFLWLALAAGVLIIFSVITWIVFRSTRKPAGEPLQAGGPQPVPTQSASPQQQPGPSQETAGHGGTPEPNKTPSNERDRQRSERKSGISFATVTIYPNAGTRGSGQANEVTIPAGAKNVLLKIPVITVRDYDKYRFELGAQGRVLVVRNLNVTIDEKLARSVSIPLPTRLLKKQSYEIRLHGITTDGHRGEPTTYSFTVK